MRTSARHTTLAGLECVRLTNGVVELLVSVSAGPRILHYSFAGAPNILGLAPAASADVAAGTWRAYGGHRLWVAPESHEYSYAPDNTPAEYDLTDETRASFRAPADAAGFVKETAIAIDESGSGVSILHRVTNEGRAPVTVAPWALTIMNGGGTAIIPQEPFRPHAEDFTPARPLVLWSYTDLSDTRWRFTQRLIRLHCSPTAASPQKIGVLNKQGWCAYHRAGDLFLKRFPFLRNCAYPDFSSNNQVYTAGDFIELESLGCLVSLAPRESCTHEERWTLHAGITLRDNDESVITTIGRLLGPSYSRSV